MSGTSITNAAAPRILLATVGDPFDTRSCSGMPFGMRTAIENACQNVTTVGFDQTRARRGVLRQGLHRMGRFGRRAEARLFTYDGSIRTVEKYAGQLGKISARRTATAVSKEMRRIVEATKPDAVIGAVMPWMLLDIPENTRLVYFTDVVTSMANTGYPAFANRSEHYKQESILLERELFERVDAAAFPASVVREAAIANGLPASKSHVVFMGPNMQPRALITEKPPPQNHLVVLIVASDPVRKQTDLALQACRGILDAGWAVDVDLIGPATPLAQSLPFVRCHGRLQLGTAKDSAIHRGALERAHLLLLPSLAEGAPIAPCEAAHFAVPSVVSAAGGLPDVVLNNQTGRVLPITAMAEEYTTAMLALISDKALYSRTSRAALQRSQAKFTWEAWAATLLSLATPHQRRLDALPECTRS